MPNLLLEANHIKKTYGERLVLDVEQIKIYDGERIALIGENGAGKSTLLSVLAGEEEADQGSVRRYSPLSYVHQSGEARFDGSARLISELRAPGRREGLSGGEMTRRRISEALSGDTPLLLADEPTTDLDAGGVELLTKLLIDYRGAIVLVSHDRSLLNKLCNRVLHLEDGKITDFPGTYEEYREELRRQREFQQFEYDRYRAERARLKAMAQQKAEWAASVKKAPKRMGNSEARLHTHEYTNAVLKQSAAKKTVQDRLERLEKKERPRDLPDIRMTLGVTHKLEAKVALTLRCEHLAAGGRTLVDGAGFTLPAGSKTALMGDNGSGKTTLLRILRGEIPRGIAFRGDVRLNPGVRMGWFDQDHAKSLDLDATVLENAMAASRLPESTARTVIARLNIRGDDVFKPVRVLSGGERAKTALAKLLLSDINLLILDEPTNHLDIFTMESLEQVLKEYGGTVLFVSHDVSFVSAVATRVLSISSMGISTFEGTFAQRTAEAARDRNAEALQLEISSVQMRLAALAQRLSAPQKGDRPDALNAEYEALSEQLRKLKRRAE
ncbi:MAG: ABC-F family ATP-binding cassette domain-containing protein [Clostridia bacterium]|nr:ABC-F family ATP-binding cassette domain-containing protein [Clostridia bacterium]